MFYIILVLNVFAAVGLLTLCVACVTSCACLCGLFSVCLFLCLSVCLCLYMYLCLSSSSSDREDSGGPWRQSGMPTKESLGPFSTDAEGGTIADVLYPRVARAAWASAPAGVEAGTGSTCHDLGQCTMSRSMIVKSHHMTEQ